MDFETVIVKHNIGFIATEENWRKEGRKNEWKDVDLFIH